MIEKLSKEGTRELMRRIGINPFLIANTLAGGEYHDEIRGLHITRIDNDKYSIVVEEDE